MSGKVAHAPAHQRVIIYSLGAMLVSLVFLSRAYALWHRLTFNPFGADFVAFWTAARLVVTGQISNVYDVATQAAFQRSVLADGTISPFFYPPTFLLFCVPLGLLPLYAALLGFVFITGTAYLLVTMRVFRGAWLSALAFPAVALNLVAGQNGMLTAAVVGACLTLFDRRPRIAGLILGTMVIKPHLALAIPIALLVSRRWKVLAYAIAFGALICLISGIVLGWDVWRQFLFLGTHTAKHILEDGKLSFFKIRSVFGLAMMVGASLPLAYTAQAISAMIALATLIWAQCRGVSPVVERSLIVVTGLLVSPYILGYDLIVMVFPCLWLMNEWVKQRYIPIQEGLLVIVTFLSPLVSLFVPIDLVVRLTWLAYLAHLTATRTATVRPIQGECHA